MTNSSRAAPLLLAPLVVAAIGAFGGTAIGQPIVMAGLGLVWGLALAGAARWLGRNERRRPALAKASVFVGALVSGVLIGWSILDLWMHSAILADAPQEFGIFLDEPLGDVFLYGLILLNTTLEWLVIPAALLLNWYAPRRRTLVLVIAVLYYAMRIWSYTYFVPHIFSWSDLPPDQPFSPELIAEFRQWVGLSWFRAL